VSVASYVNVASAELAKNLLESEGIHAVLANVNVVSWQWQYSNATGGVSVEVRRGDAQHAHALLAAGREHSLGHRPSWNCPSCGERIAGEWDVCWRCASSTEGASDEAQAGQAAAAEPVDDQAASQDRLLILLPVSIIGLFILMSFVGATRPEALVTAAFAGILVYLIARSALFPAPVEEEPQAQNDLQTLESEGETAQDGSDTKSEVSKAIVRRAWQASVLGAFGFPPLGFYSMRLLWKLAGRHTPLGTADRWRVGIAFTLSLLAVIESLLLAVVILGGVASMLSSAIGLRY
jgi:hypothetical protein